MSKARISTCLAAVAVVLTLLALPSPVAAHSPASLTDQVVPAPLLPSSVGHDSVGAKFVGATSLPAACSNSASANGWGYQVCVRSVAFDGSRHQIQGYMFVQNLGTGNRGIWFELSEKPCFSYQLCGAYVGMYYGGIYINQTQYITLYSGTFTWRACSAGAVKVSEMIQIWPDEGGTAWTTVNLAASC